MFSNATRSAAFRSANGEMAWRPRDLEQVFSELVTKGWAILGGEAWLVRKGRDIYGALPLPSGPSGVFSWSCDLKRDEEWQTFVSRSLAEARMAVQRLDVESEVVVPPDGEIFYNLTWLSPDEL